MLLDNGAKYLMEIYHLDLMTLHKPEIADYSNDWNLSVFKMLILKKSYFICYSIINDYANDMLYALQQFNKQK